MIFSTLAQSSRYAALHPLFLRAFDYIRNTDLHALAPGRHPILGDDLFVIMEHEQGRTRTEAQLECHRQYIDIQLVLEGVDEMGWKPLLDCREPAGDYNAEKDIRFFRDTPDSWIATPPGAFCIFFPEDAHAPLVASGSRCDTLLAKPADCGSNGQATTTAPNAILGLHGGLIRKAVFKIAAHPAR